MDFNWTQHATQRASQRGLIETDLQLIMAIGTEVEGGFLVRKRDYLAVEREIKAHLNRLRHLVGKRVVADEGSLITAYHAKPGKTRRLLQRR
ncbi:hypothetical protein FA04_27555 (plasmid) [Ensifer adhaerens]|nr:hypothetical protein FA04_27555 [Ensifer adhaerens]